MTLNRLDQVPTLTKSNSYPLPWFEDAKGRAWCRPSEVQSKPPEASQEPILAKFLVRGRTKSPRNKKSRSLQAWVGDGGPERENLTLNYLDTSESGIQGRAIPHNLSSSHYPLPTESNQPIWFWSLNRKTRKQNVKKVTSIVAACSEKQVVLGALDLFGKKSV